jgi:hypothetical protein
MLVDAGADVRRLTEDGRTAFHLLIQAAKPRSGKSNLESLVFLIQKGPSVHALDRQYKSVSTLAYTEDGCADPLGFRGDVWDAALATCGYDLVEFRKDHPRTPRYSQMYLRSHFEVIWGGIEHLCPYWDDEPWPDKYTEGQRHIKELSRLRARDRPLRTLSTKSNLRLS